MKSNASASVDEYIAQFPAEIQKTMQEIRAAIRAAAPGAKEIISYQIPCYYLNGDLVYFGGFKDHISFFPTSSGVAAFKDELAPYVTSKGTIQFPLDRPIPLDLITRIVEFRLAENMKKAESRAGKKKA